MIEQLNDADGIAAYELNVSCPNVHAGGMTFGADAYSSRGPGEPRETRIEAAPDREAFAKRDVDRADGPRCCNEPAPTQ